MIPSLLKQRQQEYHEMAANWRPKSKLTEEVRLHLCESPFTVDKELLASKSSTVAKLLQKNPQTDLSRALHDIPADQESMELIARFCHGFAINLMPENIVRVVCVAHYLGMTDDHCADNLLARAVLFFENQIVPSWGNSIKALKSAENVLEQAIELGMVDYCLNSFIKMVMDDPLLLGEPVIALSSSDNEKENSYRPNARRKLFDNDWKSEDLTVFSLRLYVPILHAMAQNGVPEEYIAASVCQYAKKWIFSNEKIRDNVLALEVNSQREIIEALESLLPDRKGVVLCSFLFEMLKHAIILDANGECRKRLEIRIGKQLDEARVEDMLIPCRGYAKDGRYDTECVSRILKNFYCNYTSNDLCGLNTVSELIDEFLAEIATDADLKIDTFLALADMSEAASSGTQKASDGLYRAINVYLEKHGWLTESEREEVCKALDCSRLSEEVREQAAQNKRLPVRVVVQVLFVSQLRLRDAMSISTPDEVEVREEGEDGVREEMERVERKVEELERECGAMKKEILEGGGRRKKVSMWKAVKRKFGCGAASSGMDNCNSCHVKKKKVHPR